MLIRDENITLYVPDDMDFELFNGYAYAIKEEGNALFVDKEADEAIMMFVDCKAVRNGCLKYLVDNRMLPLARYKDSGEHARGLRIVQDNLDFLYRFYRRELS